MAKFVSLRVSEKRAETPSCVSLVFDIPTQLSGDFTYQAGQYLTLRAMIDGEDVRRSYSLCSAPHEGELRVAIKQVPGGKFSTYANQDLKVGDNLDVMPPTGSFKAPTDEVKNVIGFAAGSGITPVFGIAKQVLHDHPTATFTLFYGNRSTKDVIFLEQIEGLKNQYLTRFRVYHVLSREHLGADMFFGRLNSEKCEAFSKQIFDASSVDDFYLCGPASMITGISDQLKSSGIEKSKIHFELFGTPDPSPQKATEAIPTHKQADLSKVKITFEDKTSFIDMLDDGNHLLEVALAYGMDLPYACKGGVCSTCKCKVLEGEVLMDINYALEPDEVEAGYVLSCQARPVTEEVAVTFDV